MRSKATGGVRADNTGAGEARSGQRRRRLGVRWVLVVVSTTACVSVGEPGRFEPEAPPLVGAPMSGLVAKASPWRYDSGGQNDEIARRFEESMTLHLARAQLFREFTDGVADVELRGRIVRLCEPISVIQSPVPCAQRETFGYGSSAMVTFGTLGIWPLISLFGVPTDGGTAEASLVLRAHDPQTGVELATWASGEVAETAYAGLYYRGSPMAKTLRAAADILVDKLRSSLPALEERIRKIARWRERYDPLRLSSLLEALGDPEPAIRSQALIALATLGPEARGAAPQLRRAAADPDPRVRWHSVRTLEAIEALDPASLSSVALLIKDPDPDVQWEARGVLHRMNFKLKSLELQDPELAQAVVRLAGSREERLRALQELRSRGPSAGPALRAVLEALRVADEDPIQKAAIEVIWAIGRFDPEVDRGLRRHVDRPDEVGRTAALALAELSVRPTTAAEPPAPPPASSAEPNRAIVAVFPISGGKLKARQRQELSELYAAHLTALAGFQIVPTAELAAQLRAQKVASYKECYDDACQIEIGKAIAAEKVLTTKIIFQQSGCVVSATLFDLRSEATELAAVVPGPCEASALGTTLRSVAEALRRPQASGSTRVTP